MPPNKEVGEYQPDYDNDKIRIERSHLLGHMEDGLRDHGITARSRGSGARYLSRVSPFAGQPTVDGGDDAHQPFGVEGDDSTLGVFWQSVVEGFVQPQDTDALYAFKSRGFVGVVGLEIGLQNKRFKKFRNSRHIKDSIETHTV